MFPICHFFAAAGRKTGDNSIGMVGSLDDGGGSHNGSKIMAGGFALCTYDIKLSFLQPVPKELSPDH